MAKISLSPEELLTLQLSHRSLYSSSVYPGLPKMREVARRLLAASLSSGELDLMAPMEATGGGFLHRWLELEMPESEDMAIFTRHGGELGPRDKKGQTPFMKAIEKILSPAKSSSSHSITDPMLDWLKASPSEVVAWDLPGDERGAGLLLKLAKRSETAPYDIGVLLQHLQDLDVSLSARRNGIAVASESKDPRFLEAIFKTSSNKSSLSAVAGGNREIDDSVALRQYFVGFKSGPTPKDILSHLTSRPEWMTLCDADGKPAAWYAIQADPSVLREFVEHARKKSSPQQEEYLRLLRLKDRGGRGLWSYLGCLMNHRTFTEKLLNQIKDLVPLPADTEPGFLAQLLFDVDQSARVTLLLSPSFHTRLSVSWPRDEWVADRIKAHAWSVGGDEGKKKEVYGRMAEAFIKRPKLTATLSASFLKSIGTDDDLPPSVVNAAWVGWIIGSKISEIATRRFDWKKTAQPLLVDGAQVPMSATMVDKLEKQAMKDLEGFRKSARSGSGVNYEDRLVMEFFEHLRRLAKLYTINQALPGVDEATSMPKKLRF